MNSGRTHKKDKGFTLIELLVVISIIGLLSSIVMVSLQNARKDAANAAINSTVIEYLKAIELYHTDTGNYPQLGNTTEYCLGDYKTIGTVDVNACGQWNTLPPPAKYAKDENSTLATALGQYMNGLPKVNNKDITYNSANYLGATYKCNTTSCNAITVKWWLDGTGTACARGATKTDITGRQCEYAPN